MATITNTAALQALSLLRSSKIAGFENIPITPQPSFELSESKAKFYLFRLSLLGDSQSRGIIDPSDLKVVNEALKKKQSPGSISERAILNLAGEFQRKFGISYPIRLSSGGLWDPTKIKDPTPQEVQKLAQALQGNLVGSGSQVITIHQALDFKRTEVSLHKTDILLSFLQNSGLAQKDGEMIAWINPEEVVSIQADFHHHSSLSKGFEPDGKTVIYRIVYEEKESKENKWLEVEVKPYDDYQTDPYTNGYLKALAKKTEELIRPKLKL